MSKAFDITIRPKKTSTATKPTNNHQFRGLLFLGVTIIIILMIADFNNNSNTKISADIINNEKVQSENTEIQNNPIENQNTTSNNEQLTQKITETNNSQIDNSNNKVTANIENTQSAAVIDKSKISISILNGARISNAANNTKTLLEKQGFVIEKLGNAKNLYQHTVIYFNKDKKNEAVLVQLALDNQNITLEENPSLTASNDLLIIIGAK